MGPENGYILFIGHSASRTGAPLVLLYLLRWLKGNTARPFRVLLLERGDLEADYAAVAPTMNLARDLGWTWRSAVGALRRVKLGKASKALQAARLRSLLFGRDRPALIYLNTIVPGYIIERLGPLACPVVCHVHELEFASRHILGMDMLGPILRQTTHFIACAEAVRQNLIQRHGVDPEAVDTVHEFIPTGGTGEAPDEEGAFEAARGRLAKELGLTHVGGEVQIVGAVGHVCWRKGTDLFLQLARALVARAAGPPVHFVWIGTADDFFLKQVLHDAELCGLAGRIHFPGPRDNPMDYVRGFDVFVLTSREDPYPLVCLEAASVGRPVVCFDGAGGMPEFVEDDCGVVVPYLDVPAMADRISELLADPQRRKQLGDCARDKVRRRHDVSVGARTVADLIERVLAPQPKPVEPRPAVSR